MEGGLEAGGTIWGWSMTTADVEREGENVSTCVEQFCGWERAGDESFLGVTYHHL